MASSTGTQGTAASCIFQMAEGKSCGDTKVYGTGKDALRFCWSHYVLRCAECQTRQALFECAMLTSAGSYCRLPMCSEACYKSHQQKFHQNAWQPVQRKVAIQVVFADGSIYDHDAPEQTLVEEIVFQHPVHKTHHRCLRKPSPQGGIPIYAELPQIHKPLPPPLELPRTPPPAQPAATMRSGATYQYRPQNALTAFSLHVSWLTALIETRDERIARVLPQETLQRLEQALVETTVALLESNTHGG